MEQLRTSGQSLVGRWSNPRLPEGIVHVLSKERDDPDSDDPGAQVNNFEKQCFCLTPLLVFSFVIGVAVLPR